MRAIAAAHFRAKPRFRAQGAMLRPLRLRTTKNHGDSPRQPPANVRADSTRSHAAQQPPEGLFVSSRLLGCTERTIVRVLQARILETSCSLAWSLLFF